MKTILIVILACLSVICFGQDAVIRTNGTRFDCQIVSVDSIKINYNLKTFNGYINRYINLSEVSSYLYQGKYYHLSEIESTSGSKNHIQSNNPDEESSRNSRHNLYSSDDKRSSTNAINVGFVGLQTVSVSLNYEHLFNSKHGLVVGLPLINTNKGKEMGFSLGYRHHFKSTMNSGYWGIFANYSEIKSKVEADGYALDEYKFKNANFYIGPNIGRRWIFEPGINLAIRVGYGISLGRNFEWIDIPEDDDMKDSTESIMKIISSFDAELSIGYCF
jgi:hypothetical protein